MGGDAILESLQDYLGIHAGQTTDDGRVTLEHVECNAACDYAPVVMVNWEFFDNQTPSSARDLVDALRAGEPPVPDPRRAAVHLPADRADPGRPARSRPAPRTRRSGDATLAGLRVAQELDMTAPSPGSDDAATHGPTAPKAEWSPPRTNRRRARRPPCRQAGDHRNRPEHNGFRHMTPLTPVLSRFWDEPEPWSLDTYRRHDGYRALEQALAHGSRRCHCRW